MPELAAKQSQTQSSQFAKASKSDWVNPAPEYLQNPFSALHQVLGNQAMLRLLQSKVIQPKLTVNPPGDRYEQEADRVADTVMRMPTPPIQRQAVEEEEETVQTEPLLEQITPLVQRQSVAEEEEEEPIQALTVQRQEEEEPTEKLTPQRKEEEDPVQALTIQRQDEEEEEEEEKPVQTLLVQQQTSREDERLQRNGHGKPGVSPSTVATIRNPDSGNPMPFGMRQRIEPHVGADLSGVQIHTGPSASRAANSLHARAFTHGNHIFLNRAESSSDVRLMAHESTHVVQQGAARAQRQTASSSTPHEVQRLLGIIMEKINDYARYIPGYTLFTVVIGFNPLTGDSVERNAMNLLEGLMGLVPFGTLIFDALREHGILQAAFEWVKGQLGQLNLSIARIEQTLEAAWNDMDLLQGFDYNLQVLRRHFGALLSDVESFARSLVNHIIQLIKDAAIGLAEELLADNQAWSLIKKVLKYDPLKDEPVEATTAEILEDFLRLIGKEQELEQMRERGTLEETAAWLDTQLGAFLSLLGQLRGLFTAAWDAIQPENLPNLTTNLQNLASQAVGFLQRVWDFAATVAAKVLELIKDALVNWLSSFANDIPGYHLMTVILGKDVFTQEAVPRNPTNLIRGFMSLIPGGEQQFQQMQETGVIPEAAARIETLMSDLGISWEFVRELFLGIWNSLSIEDLINPIGAFRRITNQFGEPISRLFTFVTEVVKIVLELVLVMMNFPSDIIGRIISNAMQAFEDIKRDPVGFLKNMLAAVKLGFSKFFDNILQHLLSGVTEWLFGQLRKAGIEPPTSLTLESVLDFVLQVLGITMERLWQKLAERIGQENVDRIRGAIDRLTGIWNFVRDVQERGVAAIWEYIESQISNLWDTVLEQARNWLVTRVIERVVTKLLSMLDPTGIMAVVNSFIAFFNAVQSAIEYFREMLMIVDDYVSTIASVARGAIEPGAQKLEQGLANSIPVAIGFLANQVGLGNLAEKIAEIVGGIREVVDRALDWLMDQAVKLGQAVLQTLGLGGDTTEEDRPADAQDASIPSPIVRSFDFIGEDYSLRLGPTSDGQVKVTMSSEAWGDFPSILTTIKNRQVARLNDENRTEEAAELATELQTMINEATSVGTGPVQEARVAQQARVNAGEAEQESVLDAMMDVWDEHYYDFLARLEALDAKYDFSGGVSSQVSVGDIFADRIDNILMKVSQVNVRRGADFGVRAYPANATSRGDSDPFYAYTAYAPTGSSGWGPVGPVPALLPYSSIAPGTSSWRSATRHVIMNDSARSAGSPANSSENVPGIDATYQHRGHLIANTLGGPGHYASGNIVPMTISANLSQMPSKVENPIRTALSIDPFKSDSQKNMIYDIKATPMNWNAAGTIPMSVQVTYQKLHPIRENPETETITN